MEDDQGRKNLKRPCEDPSPTAAAAAAFAQLDSSSASSTASGAEAELYQCISKYRAAAASGIPANIRGAEAELYQYVSKYGAATYIPDNYGMFIEGGRLVAKPSDSEEPVGRHGPLSNNKPGLFYPDANQIKAMRQPFAEEAAAAEAAGCKVE